MRGRCDHRSRSRALRRLAVGALTLGGAATGLVAQDALPDTLSLESALRIAVTWSPDLRRVQAIADATGADQRAALGAFLPTASTQVSLSRSNFTRTTFVGEEGESETLSEPLSSTSQTARQSINLSWRILDGGRRFATLREQSANVRAAQRRLDDQRLSVIAGVRRAFLEALRRQRLLEFTRRQITDREQELDIARRRYEIAAVERTDILAAESNLLNAQISLLSEGSQLSTGLRRLSVSMGLTPEQGPGTVLEDVIDMPAAAGLAAEDLVSFALSKDPELLALDAQRAAASAALWGARTTFLPTISASYQWNRLENFGPDQSFWQFNLGDTGNGFSVTASWDLFQGFSRTQQTANASSRKRQAEESLRLRRLEIERDVRSFVAEIDQLDQTLGLLNRALQIAEERLTMSRQMYQNGIIEFTALQQAISEVTRAERSLIEQRYNYLTAWANLEEFVGESR